MFSNYFYTLLGDETERNKVLKLWEGLNVELQQMISLQGIHPEVDTWAEVITKAEAAEISLDQKRHEQQHQTFETNRERRGRAYGDFAHNRRADNCCTHDALEQNKYNQIPRNDRDYSPKPAPKTVNERAREFFGDRTVPSCKWESPRRTGALPRKPQMSQSKRDRHYAQGLCLNCHEQGHKAQDCPKRQSVSGNGNHPPGKLNATWQGQSSTRQTASSSVRLQSSKINVQSLDDRKWLADSTTLQSTLQANNIDMTLEDFEPTEFIGKTEDGLPLLVEVDDSDMESIPDVDNHVFDFDEDLQTMPLGDVLAHEAM